jgi:hypothetical protein
MQHGFPNKPTAMAYDEKLELLAIGSKSGSIRLYLFKNKNSFCCVSDGNVHKFVFWIV